MEQASIERVRSCYCCSGSMYDVCCKPFIEDITHPLTAEQLMRSRYTAYVLIDVPYILKTTHPTTREYYNAESIKNWASSSIWEKLEVLSTEKGSERDQIGYVEFKAYYSEKKMIKHIHHEYSLFEKIDTVWYFVEGKVN